MKFSEYITETNESKQSVYELALVVKRIGSDLRDLAGEGDTDGVQREVKALEKVLKQMKQFVEYTKKQGK